MFTDVIALCLYGNEYIKNNLDIDSLFTQNSSFSFVNKIVFFHEIVNSFGNKEEVVDFSNIKNFLSDVKKRNGNIVLNFEKNIGFIITCKFNNSEENWSHRIEHNNFFVDKPFDIFYKKIENVEYEKIDFSICEKKYENILVKVYKFLNTNGFKEQAEKIEEKSINILKENTKIAYEYTDIVPENKNKKINKLLQSCFNAEFFLGFTSHCDDLYFKNLKEESDLLANELTCSLIEIILYCVNNIT